jgi:hypothetical protein
MIQIEHLIYGSFSFDGSAQHVPAQSEGIGKKTRQEITSFCNTWGDCKNFKFYSSLNQIWIQDDPQSEPEVAIIKITHHGRDFSGRSGAMLRHALVLKERDYRELDFSPFRVEELKLFKTDWKDGDTCETLYVDLAGSAQEDLSVIPQSVHQSLKENLRFLLGGRSLLSYRIANTPKSDSYLKALFSLIPCQRRKGLALTTFAFRKNRDYQLGCIYSPQRIPGDDSALEFERKEDVSSSGWTAKDISDYLDPLFINLKQNDLGEASARIRSYSAGVKV